MRYALKAFTLEGGHVDVLKNKFLTEGRVLARLHDQHLVRVFDLNFDETTGTPYFVMELVLSEDSSPRTLSDVRTDELDEDCVLQWFSELASVFDYIHEQGIVHRDIKLGNVLLSSDGHVVLSDFGISRLFSERLRSDVKAVNTMVSEAATSARLMMGTQGYMAPEVARGGSAAFFSRSRGLPLSLPQPSAILCSPNDLQLPQSMTLTRRSVRLAFTRRLGNELVPAYITDSASEVGCRGYGR